MSSTTTRNKIGQEDIKWWDGITDTFTRETSTGGLVTLSKIGSDVFVAEAYGSGIVSETALSTAIANIGTTRVRSLVLCPGTWSLTNDLTIPSNLTLKPLPGAILDVATTKTLTINGIIEAGPCQIFSWSGTGTIDLSGSSMSVLPIQWWGAATGTGNDNADIITQAQSGLDTNGRQALYFSSEGVWRIASALAFTNTINWQGDGIAKTNIYVDVGANVGVTVDAGTELLNCRIEGISFVGPANCCTSALQMVTCDYTKINAGFALGSTSFAFHSQGNIFLEGEIRVYAGSYAANCHDGIYLQNDSGTGWDNNNAALRIHITTVTDIGLKIDGNPATGKITGSLENVATILDINGGWNLEFENFHIESDGDITFTGCEGLTLNGFFVYSDSAPVTFVNCKDVFSQNSYFYSAVTIGADCRGFVFGSTKYAATWDDNAPDTCYAGPIIKQGLGHALSAPSPGTSTVNLFANALMDRWTAGNPDEWATGANITYTKCGTGLGDTTNHNTPYCAKLVSDSADQYPTIVISTAVETFLKNQWANFTLWVKIDSGQTFTAGDYPWIQLYPTIPDWVANTDYSVGDAVADTAGAAAALGRQFLCVTAGTSDATEPASWDTTIGNATTDNTVTWRCVATGPASITNTPMSSADVGGPWKQLRAECFMPRNATDLGTAMFFPIQADTSDGTYYVSEPCLLAGRLGPRGVAPGLVANSLTLDNGGGTTTTVTDPMAKTTSKIILTPTSAGAAAAVGAAAGVYVSTKNNGSFVVTHPATPGASSTMDYQIIN